MLSATIGLIGRGRADAEDADASAGLASKVTATPNVINVLVTLPYIMHSLTRSMDIDEIYRQVNTASKVLNVPWQIGIDTGAYVHGVLTAIVLEGDERRYI